MESEPSLLVQHGWPVGAMLLGVVTHILKKAMKYRQQDVTFKLREYLLGHPYQTALTFIAGAGGYLTLLVGGDGVDLAAAFFAGVAANSLGDLAPGDRTQRVPGD